MSRRWNELAEAAYAVHQEIWFFGENNEFPKGLAELPRLDERLSAALSRIPYQPTGGNMGVRLNTERKGVSLVWDAIGDQEVTVFATGEQGDVHNKLPQPNTGEAGIFYPADFSGSSHIEVRDVDGNVISEGDITV